jgi:cyclopropane-fatty-acyl-phospholipid synthase
MLPLAEVVRVAEETGFETRDVESMREHYLLTVRHWIQRLEAHRREAIALVGDATFRAWRLYLAASANAFATGRIGHVQIVLSKPDSGRGGGRPSTRENLYGESAASPSVRTSSWQEVAPAASKYPARAAG